MYGFVKGFDKIMTEENSLYGMVSDEEWEALKLSKKEKQMGILNVILVSSLWKFQHPRI